MVGFARTIIMYTLVIIVLRCMGKRQIGQLQPYEFVIALMISDVASIPMQDIAVPLWNGIIPILSLQKYPPEEHAERSNPFSIAFPFLLHHTTFEST